MTPLAEKILPQLESWRAAERWWLGLSGGLDSCTLLSLLVEFGDVSPPLTAVYVDHQLHPDSARWGEHCAGLCERLGVAFVSRRVQVEDTGEGPEAAARAARYAVFESLLGSGDALMLAHHLDDQVETFFLRLMRGAGPRGLAGMPASRTLGAGSLVRPLLGVTRTELEVYAQSRDLLWIEDTSNTDLAMDRNFLRHRVLPLLQERWPGYRQNVQRSVGALADVEQVIEELDGKRLGTARGDAYGEALLRLDDLAPHSEQELARLLRRWLDLEGQAAPPQSRLLEFSRQSMTAQGESLPQLECPGYCLRCYRGDIYLDAGESSQPPGVIELVPDQSVTVPGLGCLVMVAAEQGLRVPETGCWQLRFRQGGERCRPVGRDRSQSLKKLLQERRVPPWLREQMPLVYAGDELAAVADLWICEGHQAEPGETAYKLAWRRNSAAAD